MILKGSQRGGGKQLAAHLLKTKENEHVEVHELRGFSSDDLDSALHEVYAVSRGTRAKQFLFSLSLNPPEQEHVPVEAFEAAIEAVEQKMGLQGQPRAIVFHEKDGRRHAHVVWSRIDTDKMKAINLPHYKLKLRDVSRQLYLEHGWQIPRGLLNSKERDPRNYTREEWEQAKRAKQDPKMLKSLFQECWASSDSPKAFAQALEARGYTLARGDRRSHVAVDFRGEVYAIAKWVGVKTRDVRACLGSGDDLPSIEKAKSHIASRMNAMLRCHIAEAELAQQKRMAMLALQREQIVERQRKERADLQAAHAKRAEREKAERASRLNKGFRGLWDRLTGRYGKQAAENEREHKLSAQRDRREKNTMIERQLDERQSLHILVRSTRAAHARDMEQLNRDVAEYMRMGKSERLELREKFRDASAQRSGPSKDRGMDRGSNLS
ncbi:MAG: relaxase [Micavibrio aeruginosavorus]|uniref:Relaxase n=1 Tax=Micavibrio aeruginosavorus TaxID=349221 RepID=A0A7T5R0C6_9BACT|nr:MAG: relaxase [Micavibrio aeruginosavorus]